jgi:hypothetical protein
MEEKVVGRKRKRLAAEAKKATRNAIAGARPKENWTRKDINLRRPELLAISVARHEKDAERRMQ